jgi:hypothetical protein
VCSSDLFTAGAFDLYSVRNGESLITMYEYGGQAFIKAPRGNGLFFIEGGLGGNDYLSLNQSITVYPAGGAYTRENGVDISANTRITGSLVISGSLTVTSSLFDSTNSTGSSGQVLSSNASGRLEWITAGGGSPINTGSFATTGSNTFVGNQVISGSLDVTSGITGSLLGTASFATSASLATSASYALTSTSASFATTSTSASFATTSISSSYAATASYVVTAQTASFYSLAAVTQNAVFSGSVRGEVEALTISSATASLDCSLGNFFTITLATSSATFINPTNIQPGQTINLRVKQQGTTGAGLVSFPTSVKQVSGSAYVPTATINAEDIVTFISFDSSNLYLSNIKNFV